MSAGNNLGGNLNVFIFELGMLTRDPLGILPDRIKTIAVHPMVVNPSTIRYQDSSRSTVVETPGGSVLNKAGRAMRSVQFVGTFGVESRGLGLTIGTGDLRFKRFYHEIVRMADAVTKDQMKAENDPFRSPGVALQLLTYDADKSSFFVNFYDFWHDVQFEALVPSFSFAKAHRNGGATGLTSYQLGIKECGPIVTGGVGTAIINGMFQALTAWDSINEIVKSYTLEAVTGSLVDAAGIVVGQFADSMNAVAAQIDGATGVVNGFADPTAPIKSRTSGATSDGQGSSGTTPSRSSNSNVSNSPGPSASAPEVRALQRQQDDSENGASGLSGFLASSAAVVSNGTSILDTLRAQGTPTEVDSPGGAIDWGSLDGEGTLPGLDAADQQDALAELLYAAAFQPAVGALYGMSREEYASFLAATGRSGREPRLAGTVEYTVTQFDTASSIEKTFGIAWSAILRLNNLLPDEALLSGTRLLIPRERVIGQPSAIAGLPVFGSHAGRSAWGKDLFTDLRIDPATGGFQVAEGPELLEQGINWLVNLFSEELANLANESPSTIQGIMIQKRVASLLSSDKRIASVDEVTTSTDGVSSSLDVAVTVTAINGGTISTAQGTA